LLSHFIDKTGRKVLPAQYLDPRVFQGNVARVSSPENGLVGLIDREGKQLVDFRYHFIERFVEGVARTNMGGWLENGTLRGGKWGLIATDGTVILEPTYDSMLEPDSGRITVRLDKLMGFIDLQGKVIVEPSYSFTSWHGEGLAVVATDGGDGYVDVDGAMVIAPQFHEASPFKDGIAKVKMNDLWGIIDKTGAFVHEAVYEKLGRVVDGACWAVKDGACYVLNAAGVLGDSSFDEIKQVNEDGIWPVRTGEQWGFLHADGRVVGMGFDGVMSYSGGLARVNRGGKWGFADKDANLVIECKYEDAFGFDEERAAVLAESGWTFVDPAGNELSSGGFAGGHSYQDGMCPVKIDGKWGFLDQSGALAIPAEYDWVGYFSDGLAAAFVADTDSVALATDRDGVHVLPPGGLEHPVFQTADANAHLIGVLGFASNLSDQKQEFLRKLIEAWERGTNTHGAKLYTEDKWVSPFNVYVRIQNLDDPRRELSLLVEEMTGAGFPINEALYARWGHPPTEKVMQPNADPRMPKNMEAYFADFEEYWDAVWNPDGPIPAPENYHYLKGALQDQNGKLTLEERHTPMWLDDVKICMGAMSGAGEDYLPANEAAIRVGDAVAAAVEKRFANTWVKPGMDRRPILPTTRQGDVGVERIEYQGRTGYSFAFECGYLLHWFSSPRCRWREPEMMDAMRAVIQELDLEPVILWQRFQEQIPMMPMGRPTVMVVNLWDKK
jgi:hypothetical protein